MYFLYIDGGARGNPGPAAYGWVLKDTSGAVVSQEGKFLGKATNNVAEYEALQAGLTYAVKEQVQELTVYSDSELLVRQLTGIYKIKNEKLQEIANRVIQLKNKIPRMVIKHIGRELNEQADALVNDVLDMVAESNH